MKRSVVIPLSRDEEDTMRLVALGITNLKELRPADVDGLGKLRFVEKKDGKVTLTDFGKRRLVQSQERVFRSIPSIRVDSAFTRHRGLTQR